jgi:hypothetical protein
MDFDRIEKLDRGDPVRATGWELSGIVPGLDSHTVYVVEPTGRVE